MMMNRWTSSFGRKNSNAWLIAAAAAATTMLVIGRAATTNLMFVSAFGVVHTTPKHLTIVGSKSNRYNHNFQRLLEGGGRQSSSSFFSRRRRRGRTTHDSSSCSSLQMMAMPGVAAVAGVVSGGFFAGGLHAIAGPDHLAALLPRCCGQRWYRAGRIGVVWGMGHGFSAALLGTVAFFCKNHFSKGMSMSAITPRRLHWMASTVTEIAVGLSLVVVGLLGLKEAREWEADQQSVQPLSLSAAAVVAEPGMTHHQRAVLFNGLLHGFSWDGAPSLAPALAVATWRGNLAFLLAYGVGTTAVMAIATTLLGEGTRCASQVLDRPNLPQKLSLISSIVAIVIGVVWCSMGLRG